MFASFTSIFISPSFDVYATFNRLNKLTKFLQI